MSSAVRDPRECEWCEMTHSGVCPRIKAIEYHPDGLTIKRVEFHPPQPIVAGVAPLVLPGSLPPMRQS